MKTSVLKRHPLETAFVYVFLLLAFFINLPVFSWGLHGVLIILLIIVGIKLGRMQRYFEGKYVLNGEVMQIDYLFRNFWNQQVEKSVMLDLLELEAVQMVRMGARAYRLELYLQAREPVKLGVFAEEKDVRQLWDFIVAQRNGLKNSK